MINAVKQQQAQLNTLNFTLNSTLKEILSFNLNVGGKFVSPLVETDNLMAKITQTNVIKPQSDNDLVIQLDSNNQQLTINNQQSESVASIDSSGNATFSGQLTAHRLVIASEAKQSNEIATGSGNPRNDTVLEVQGSASISNQLTALEISARKVYTESLQARSASISGRLTALEISAQNAQFNNVTASEGHFRRLFADAIDGLEDTIATVAGSLYNDLYFPTETPLSKSELALQASASALLAQSDTWLTENQPASLELSSLDAAIITASDFLAVLGKASMVNVEITQKLVINDTMHIADNTIGVVCGGGFCDNTLYLQPTGMGRINMLAGKFTIDENGNVRIAGDAYIAGRVYTEGLEARSATISGQLYADSIKSNRNGLSLVIASEEKQSNEIATGSGNPRNDKNARVYLANQTGDEVASIDASGTAKFKKLMIAAAEATPSSEGFAQFLPELTSNEAAGEAVLKAGIKEVTIYNKQVGSKSLIYITPASDTLNKVLYTKSKAEGVFKVAISQPITKDIKFYWWIIN